MKRQSMRLIWCAALGLALGACGEEQMATATDGMGAGEATAAPESSDASAGGGATGAPSNGQSDSDGYGDAGETATDDVAGVEPGVDDEVDTADEPLWVQLSPDDSTSMASAQIFKSNAWGYQPLKAHEFINYYDAPVGHFEAEPWALQESLEAGLEFGLVADRFTTDSGPMIDCEAGDDCAERGEYEVAEVLFQLRSEQVDLGTRRGWNIFLCVDVSGSMGGEKMEFTRDALRATVGNLRAGDKLTLVTFSTGAETVFTGLDVESSRDDIMTAIDGLRHGGSTNMLAGLDLTYDLAQENFDPEMLHRVLLFGDGNANVGNNDIDRYESLTRINGQEGIYLTGVGVGTDYDLERMDRLTDAGKGAHIFLPNADEVDLIFGDYFTKLVEVAADSIEIVMELPAGTTLESFSGEEVSTNPEERVQNVIIAAGDDMTFTARFAVEREEAWGEAVKLSITYRPLGSGEALTQDFEVERFSDLVATPGALFKRTRLIRDFAFHVTGQRHPDLKTVSELSGEMQLVEDDWAITELLGFIDRL